MSDLDPGVRRDEVVVVVARHGDYRLSCASWTRHWHVVGIVGRIGVDGHLFRCPRGLGILGQP